MRCQTKMIDKNKHDIFFLNGQEAQNLTKLKFPKKRQKCEATGGHGVDANWEKRAHNFFFISNIFGDKRKKRLLLL